MITILLVDDQPTVRRGLKLRLGLEPDLAITGEAGDGAEALGLVAALRPDVVIMDVEMPVLDGIAATAAIRALPTRSAVVILSLHDDEATKRRAREAGAAEFVAKCEPADALPAAIRRAGTARSA